jgi:hypothetical protein
MPNIPVIDGDQYEPVMGVIEAANRLGITDASVRTLQRNGHLGAVYEGDYGVRVEVWAVERLIAVNAAYQARQAGNP